MKNPTTSRKPAVGLRGLPWTAALYISAWVGFAQSNSVLSLDGSSGSVQIPSAASLQNPGAITIEAWIYPIHPNSSGQWFIAKSDGQIAWSSRSYEVCWVTNSWNVAIGEGIEVNLFLNTRNWVVLGATLPESNWVHVATTYASTNGLFQVFTNGVLAASTTTNALGQPLAGQLLRQTSLPLGLGGQALPSRLGYAHGYMDEVRIWTTARTEAEIAQSRFCRLTGTEPNLAGYWTFDNGDAFDLTGHGNNGTLSGGASIVPISGLDAVHAGQCGPETPHAATATPVVVNGFVVDANVTDSGSGYTNAPLVRVIGGSGTGAQAVATMNNGFVTAVNVISTGSGYTNAPIIVIAPPFIPQPKIDITALVFGPLATPVARLDFSELSRYEKYQLEFKPDATGTWTDLGAPFIPTASTNTQYVDAVGGAGFIRVRYVP